MRIRTESVLITASLLLASIYSASAAEPTGTGSAKDHNCNLPANVRSKVDHCDQVGDFDSTEHRKKPGFLQKDTRAPGLPIKHPPAESAKLSKPKTGKKGEKSVKKDIIEMRSDSEPPALTK
jgi:hypothetical protein